MSSSNCDGGAGGMDYIRASDGTKVWKYSSRAGFGNPVISMDGKTIYAGGGTDHLLHSIRNDPNTSYSMFEIAVLTHFGSMGE